MQIYVKKWLFLLWTCLFWKYDRIFYLYWILWLFGAFWCIFTFSNSFQCSLCNYQWYWYLCCFSINTFFLFYRTFCNSWRWHSTCGFCVGMESCFISAFPFPHLIVDLCHKIDKVLCCLSTFSLTTWVSCHRTLGIETYQNNLRTFIELKKCFIIFFLRHPPKPSNSSTEHALQF